MESAKIIVNLSILIIACGTLFVPINKVASGVYERFNVGVLAASLFMFGNMLFVSFLYLMNIGVSYRKKSRCFLFYEAKLLMLQVCIFLYLT